MNKRTVLVLMLVLTGLTAFAGEKQAEKKTAAEIRAEMERLRERAEELERQLGDKEVQEERAEALADIQAESRERLNEYEEEMRDLKAELEDAHGAWQALIRNSIAHLTLCKGIDQKIMAVKGAENLEQAQKLLRELETVQTRWWMVDEPRQELAAEVEEMAQVANELGDQDLRKLTGQLRELGAARAKNAVQQYELWKARLEMNERIENIIQQFHQRAERLEEELEDEDDEDDED